MKIGTWVGGVIKVWSSDGDYPTNVNNANAAGKADKVQNQTKKVENKRVSVIFDIKQSQVVNNVNNSANSVAQSSNTRRTSKISLIGNIERKIEKWNTHRKIDSMETFRRKIKALIFRIKEFQSLFPFNGRRIVYRNFTGIFR